MCSVKFRYIVFVIALVIIGCDRGQTSVSSESGAVITDDRNVAHYEKIKVDALKRPLVVTVLSESVDHVAVSAAKLYSRLIDENADSAEISGKYRVLRLEQQGASLYYSETRGSNFYSLCPLKPSARDFCTVVVRIKSTHRETMIRYSEIDLLDAIWDEIARID